MDVKKNNMHDMRCCKQNIEGVMSETSIKSMIIKRVWNLKDDDDIQLKRGYFYRSLNSLCVKFKGILNNPNVASKHVSHIVVVFVVPNSDICAALRRRQNCRHFAYDIFNCILLNLFLRCELTIF